MRLAEILSARRVNVRLEVADKKAALESLAALLAEGESDLDPRAITEVFEAREALASTGVGSGVAIPHGRLPGLEKLSAAVAISRGGVDFDAIDGRPAHILVAVLAPDRQSGDHLKALARFSRVLREERVRRALLEAEDAEQALEILVEGDGRH